MKILGMVLAICIFIACEPVRPNVIVIVLDAVTIWNRSDTTCTSFVLSLDPLQQNPLPTPSWQIDRAGYYWATPRVSHSMTPVFRDQQRVQQLRDLGYL